MPREIAYNWLDRAHTLSAEESMFVARLQSHRMIGIGMPIIAWAMNAPAAICHRDRF